jgi:hypothetical protein
MAPSLVQKKKTKQNKTKPKKKKTKQNKIKGWPATPVEPGAAPQTDYPLFFFFVLNFIRAFWKKKKKKLE